MLEQLVTLSPDVAIVTDATGQVCQVSPHVRDLLGYAPEALIGRPVEVLVPAARRAAHVAHRRATGPDTLRRMSQRPDLHAVAADGRLVPVDIALRPLTHEGRPYVLAVLRDVGHLRRLQRELERQAHALTSANEQLEAFAHVVAHDLKAPLRAMRFHAALVEEGLGDSPPADAVASLNRIQVLSDRMAVLIDGVLRYARVGLAADDEPGWVDLRALVADVVECRLVPAGFTIEVADDLPRVRGCPLELRQIFANLIGNALDHHDGGAGRLTIRAVADDGQLRFEFADDGPGVPPEDRARIFNLFETGEGRASAGAGSGIGLAIVRRIVERHGGRVDVRPNAMRGSTFWFTWPREEAP